MNVEAFIGLIIQGVVLIIGAVLKLTQVEKALLRAIHEERAKLDRKIEAEKDALVAQITTVNAKFSLHIETIVARINALEIKGLETYVRRDSFKEATNHLFNQLTVASADLKEDIKRLEGKVDKIKEQ